MKKEIKRMFSGLLVVMLLISNSSSIIYNLYASSEFVADSSEFSQESEANEELASNDINAFEEEENNQGFWHSLASTFQSEKTTKVEDQVTSLEIVGYDHAAGMNLNTVYDLKVKIDFGSDITSDNKSFELTLPDGMVFAQIPVVKDLYDNTDVDTGILSTVPSDDQVALATTQIIVPTAEPITESTFGTAVYTLDRGTKAIEFVFKVKLDSKKIVSSHLLSEEISVSVSSAGNEIGNVTQPIKTNADRQLEIGTYIDSATVMMPVSTVDDEYIGETPRNSIKSGSGVYTKNITMYHYYPEGSEYVDLVTTSDFLSVEHIPEENLIILRQKDEYLKVENIFDMTAVRYKFPESTVPGEYANANPTVLEYETYNGEQYSVSQTENLYTVNVIDEAHNTMNVTMSALQDDNTIQGISQGGVALRIRNTNAYTVENQVVEYKIDDSLKANVIAFAYDMGANNSQRVSDIMYKTHQEDTWNSFNQEQLDSVLYYENSGVIVVDELNLNSEETISEIKIVTNNYQSSFTSGATLNLFKSPVGVFADIIAPHTEGDITFTQYDFNDDQVKTSLTRTFKASENAAEQIATSNSRMYYINQEGMITSNITAGEEFTVRGYVGISPATELYQNLQVVKNPVIYIRETDEYVIDISSLELTYKNEVVDYTYEEQMDVEGNTVYKIMTSPDVEVGSLFNLDEGKFQYSTLLYKVDVLTDPFAVNNIVSDDFILYNSNEYDITGDTKLPVTGDVVAVADKYDIDNDGDTTDMLMSNPQNTLFVKANTNIIVESSFSKVGTDETVEFIHGDDTSAVMLEPTDRYEYITTVTNNAGESVDDFTALFPIPKTGDDWGAFFQDAPYTWDMTIDEWPTVPSGFDYYYSIDVTPSTILNGATWIKIEDGLDDSALNDIKMIKVVTTHSIAAKEQVELRIPYVIGETYQTTIDDDKAGNVNVFRVAYEQKTSSYNGVLSGTWVGTTYALNPVIQVEDIEVKVGTAADLLDKVEATDFYNDLIDASNITYQASHANVENGVYTKAGTYQIEYTATDRNGLSVTGTRVIYVNGLPELVADDQTYYLTDEEIAKKVEADAEAYSYLASDTVDSQPVKKKIEVTYEIVSYTDPEEENDLGDDFNSEINSEIVSEIEEDVEDDYEHSSEIEDSRIATRVVSEESTSEAVNQSFDKIGLYDVKYSAEDEFGQTVEKVVLVTILEEELTEEASKGSSEAKSDKLSDMTIADTGVNIVGAIISTLAILISLIVIKNNLRV